jgi:membrane-bound serine protease (ClpP class)
MNPSAITDNSSLCDHLSASPLESSDRPLYLCTMENSRGARWASIGLLLVLAGLAVIGGRVLAEQETTGAGTAYVLTIDDAIGPATRDHILRGLARAEKEEVGLLVLRLNTPGGLDASMRDIIQAILTTDVPVATWVAPAGSRAASAGTYILYASHIAAMAPSTNLGAATPVQIGGGQDGPSPLERARDAWNKEKDREEADGEQDASSDQQDASSEQEAAPEQPPGDSMSRKVINDAVAYIKGLAERHDRNADWAERAVREAVSLTASEALAENVIDVVAGDLGELLTAIDGRQVRMDSGLYRLSTADLIPIEIETDWRTDLLAIITNPTLAYMLLMVGIYGLLLEGYNPGALLPGVVGGICLLLALYSFQILPVNYAGLALIVLGLALIAVELFVPSFGVLGIGGIVAVVFGSVILFDTDVPDFRVNTGLIAGMGFGSAAIFGIIVWHAARTIVKPRGGSGREAMIGLQAEALDDFSDGRGRVHVQGEDWSARAEQPIRAGETVRIIGMETQGFVLTVTPAPTSTTGNHR